MLSLIHIYAHARIVVIPRCKQQQLLDALVIHRSLGLQRGNRVVLDVNLICARLLRDGLDASNRSLGGSGSRAGRRRGMNKDSVGGSHATGEAEDQNRRRQRGREAHLPQPVRRIERQTMPEAALLGRLQRFLQLHARSRQKVGRRLRLPLLRQESVELLLRLQFGGAVSTCLLYTSRCV